MGHDDPFLYVSKDKPLDRASAREKRMMLMANYSERIDELSSIAHDYSLQQGFKRPPFEPFWTFVVLFFGIVVFLRTFVDVFGIYVHGGYISLFALPFAVIPALYFWKQERDFDAAFQAKAKQLSEMVSHFDEQNSAGRISQEWIDDWRGD